MVDSWLNGLLDDASCLGTSRVEVRESLPWLGESYDQVIGSLVLPDDRLAAVNRTLRTDRPVPCRVVNTGGAGGLVALARRRFDRLRPVGIRGALRDLDDLGGAAARIAMAARELDPEVTVLIELPDAPGWPRAVETAELEGLSAAVADIGDRFTERLSALIEADVPFVITGPVHGADRVVELIMIVSALIDGASPADLTPGLVTAEQGDRIRRRLLGIEIQSVPEVITGLVDRGWLAAE